MKSSVYHICIFIVILNLFSCCCPEQQDGVQWIMAAYRVRRSYEFMEGQTLPKLQELMDILDISNDTSLRQKDSYTSTQGAVVMRLVEFHNDRDVKDSQLDVSVKADGTIERVGGRVTRGLGKVLRKYIRRNCKLFKKGAEKIAMVYEGIEPHEVKIERTFISKDLVVTDNGSAYITVAADVTWLDPCTDSGNFTRKIYTIDACNKTVMDVELHAADVFNAATATNLEKPKEVPNNKNTMGKDNNNVSKKIKAEKRIPCETPASGFGGNLKTGVIQYGVRPYCLDLEFVNDTCFLRNDHVKVVDMHNDIYSNRDRVVSFPCKDGYNDTINGGYSVALDTFFHATQTIKMYNDWYGFQPLSDTRALVHFDPRVDNAYWDGRTLMVGDGGKTDTYPFSTLDTVAHEISHGVTEHRSGLRYRGESGAINEAFSDIAGEAVEVYVRGINDWMVGADVTKAKGRGIRYLDDPPRDGISIGHVRGFYEGMDVHRSSGIMNKAFYIVSQTLGVRHSFGSFVLANRLYWRETSTFEDAACDVIKASYDSGYPMEVFEDAFRKVGLRLKKCPDLTQYILFLNTNETRKGLSVSKTVNPMFIVKPPSSAKTMEVFVPEMDDVTIVLSKSYLRNDGLVLAKSKGAPLITYRFEEQNKEALYLRIVGDSANTNIQIISLNVKFV